MSEEDWRRRTPSGEEATSCSSMEVRAWTFGDDGLEVQVRASKNFTPDGRVWAVSELLRWVAKNSPDGFERAVEEASRLASSPRERGTTVEEDSPPKVVPVFDASPLLDAVRDMEASPNTKHKQKVLARAVEFYRAARGAKED